MADVRELENTTGSEFEAIVDDLEGWNCPVKVVGDWDNENELILIFETWAVLNEEINYSIKIDHSMLHGSGLIGTLINHIKEGLE